MTTLTRSLPRCSRLSLPAAPLIWGLVFTLVSILGCSKKTDEAGEGLPAEFHSSGFAQSHALPLDGARAAIDDVISHLAAGSPDASVLDDKMTVLEIRIHDGAANPIELLSRLTPSTTTLMTGLQSGSLDAATLAAQLEEFRDGYLGSGYWLSGARLATRLQSRVDEMLSSYEVHLAAAGPLPEQEREPSVQRMTAEEYAVTVPELREYLRRAGE